MGQTHRKHGLALAEVTRTFPEVFAAELLALIIKYNKVEANTHTSVHALKRTDHRFHARGGDDVSSVD